MRIRPVIFAGCLVGTVVLANWMVVTFGLVPAGFGLLVPAGTYAAGLALGFRDALQRAGNIYWVIGAIAVGGLVSLLVGDGRIAVASACAFLLAELADTAVYTPLRNRNWPLAVFASNAVGAVVDTIVFLSIAGFGLSPQIIGGQLLVKAGWMTIVFLLFAEGARRIWGSRKVATA